MSHLGAIENERRRAEEQSEGPARRRLGVIAVVALLTVAVAVGVSEMRLLASFNADDVSSILFEAG